MFPKRSRVAADGYETQPSASSASSASSPSGSRPQVSPLHTTFNFELPDFDAPAPQTPWTANEHSPSSSQPGDSPSSATSRVSLTPPVLPPIKRVVSGRGFRPDSKSWGYREEHGSEDKRANAMGSITEQSDQEASESGVTSTESKTQDTQPPRTEDGGTPRMVSSLFPPPKNPEPPQKVEPRQPVPRVPMGPAMSREWIDSRDRPYSQPAARPTPLQTMQSSPVVPSINSPASAHPSSTTRSPLSQPTASTTPSRPHPHSHTTSPNVLQQRPLSHATTDYSGSTAWSVHSSRSTAPESPSQATVGTPYQTNSPTNPLPHHVNTRPSTGGLGSKLAGVGIPTHHSSSRAAAKAEKAERAEKADKGEKPEKTERRRTRLLNPMALLARRRSAHPEAAASSESPEPTPGPSRQKSGTATGVTPIPDDFDPRIKGNVVHDFSAPRRESRNYSYSEADGFHDSERRLPSSSSAPLVAAIDRGSLLAHPQGDTSAHQREPSIPTNPRLSQHQPHFTELLAENPSADARMSSLQAERLENKDFLQRASHHGSTASQESSVLPPFARKSPNVEPPQTFLNSPDAGSNRSSDPSSARARYSSGSELDHASPNTHHSSGAGGQKDTRSSHSSSSISPYAQDISQQRPAAERMSSNFAPSTELQPSSQDDFWKRASGEKAPSDTFASSFPGFTMEQTPSPFDPSWGIIGTEQGTTQKPRDEQPVLPDFNAMSLHPQPEASQNSSGVPSTIPSPSIPSSGGTPVTHIASAFMAPRPPPTPPKLVEKRASAIGHSSKASSGFPKHHASNASRFSFQLGGASSEERVLEDRHRKKAMEAAVTQRGFDEEDEDDFDEDAMDDMDEMELRDNDSDEELDEQHDDGRRNDKRSSMVDVMDQLRAGQMDDEEGDQYGAGGRAWKPANQTGYMNSQGNDPRQTQPGDGWSNANALTPWSQPGVPQDAPHMGQQTEDFAIHMPVPQRPLIPSRDSGNSEQNRNLSGYSFGANAAKHKSVLSSSTVGSGFTMADSDRSSWKPQTNQASTRASGAFGDFRFYDESRPGSQQAVDYQRASQVLPESGLSSLRSSHLPPPNEPVQYQAYTKPQSISHPGVQLHDRGGDDDDMYFDGGGFEADDLNDHSGEAINEDAFDDDQFLKKANGSAQQPQDRSSTMATDIGHNGPYPSFAMPSSSKARQRDSNMMLEDLPFQTDAPVDPRSVPRRNPSEDAKRLGLSSQVPPLPPQSEESSQRLQAYHTALANAANQAAADGRFARAPSVASTATSISLNPKGTVLSDDKSFYSRNTDSDKTVTGDLDRTLSIDTSESRLNQPQQYSLPNFDFGFNGQPLDDFGDNTAPVDDYEDDDDIVAAANADALAEDDDGFYGQEFGFYANARPNSAEAQAINGGFFGIEGDDGLQRNWSLRAPDLTPITERSEFSTRNSFVGSAYGPPSAGGLAHLGPMSPALARLPHTPASGFPDPPDLASFEQLRKLRATAFNASNGSLPSPNAGLSNRSSATGAGQGYFFPSVAPPRYSSTSNHSDSSPVSATNSDPLHPPTGLRSARASQSPQYSPIAHPPDPDATPRKPPPFDAASSPSGVRKASVPGLAAAPAPPFAAARSRGHSRNSSGADSVAYVREPPAEEGGRERWVLERRRTGEMGRVEVVGREVVGGGRGGWI